MKVLEQSEQRLVVGGWNTQALVWAGALAAVLAGVLLVAIVKEPGMIVAFLFAAVICGTLLGSLNFRERIDFDRLRGEVRIHQLRLLGWKTRIRRINADSRVEIEKSHEGERRRPNWRMVLITDGERTPFSSIFYRYSFNHEAALLNGWLGQTPDAGEHPATVAPS